jgi:aminoglycoside phosphotransferase (APT) family kinase protein
VAKGLERDVVDSGAEAAGLARPPLLVLERVRAFLDEQHLGSGRLTATRIGSGGGSNFSFLLERGADRYVLRRPPRPPLPPSAHDVVREANLQLALAPLGIRVPHIRAICEDESLLGVPFYVADYIDGVVVADTLPPGLKRDAGARRRLGYDLVDTLVEIHAVDASAPALAPLVRPGSYLERQVRRFSDLWGVNATRELPIVAELGTRLAASLPEPLAPTVVHGDYRLGNMILGSRAPDRIVAVLDWEMGAIGDPRADLGYLLGTYTEPGGAPSPLGSSPVTATPGFPSREELAARYAERSGRTVEPLAWFEALALWKAAVFCEAIYGRYTRGELTADDTRAAAFESIVPALASTASALLSSLRV